MRVQKNIPEQLNLSDFEDKTLLILDDDDPLRGRLARAMEKKGFQVKEAKTVAEGLNMVKSTPPAFACVDLRLEDGNGLDVVNELSKINSDLSAKSAKFSCSGKFFCDLIYCLYGHD